VPTIDITINKIRFFISKI